MAQKASPSPDLRYPEWQREYLAALFELDKKKLPARVAAAEAVIISRLQALSQSPDHRGEPLAIEDALRALRVLKRENLDSPDWE